MYILCLDKATLKLLGQVCISASHFYGLTLFARSRLENLGDRLNGLAQAEENPDGFAVDVINSEIPTFQALHEARRVCPVQPYLWTLITNDNVRIEAKSLWEFHKLLIGTYGEKYASFILAWAQEAQEGDKIVITSHGIIAQLEVKHGNPENHRTGINRTGNPARNSENHESGGPGKNRGNQAYKQEAFISDKVDAGPDHYD